MKMSRSILAILALAWILSLAPLVYGQTTSTAGFTVSLELNGLIAGALSGAFYGALGYYADTKTNVNEKFNSKQFAITIALGTIIGLFIPITTPTDTTGLLLGLATAFSNFGAIYFIQKGITIFHAFTGKKVVLAT